MTTTPRIGSATPLAQKGWSPWWLGVMGAVVAFALYWGPPALRQWKGNESGTDSVPYTDIAIQVARGNGLSENRQDPLLHEWFQIGPAAPPGTVVPSTRWPPLFPLAMGTLFRVWHYDLSAALTLNCLVMALACGIITALAARRHGPGMATCFIVIFALIDERTRANARVLMTEPFATLLVSATAVALIRFGRQPRLRTVIAAGVLCGAATLARSIVFLWVPGLVLLVVWLARRSGKSWAGVVAAATTFVAGALMVCLPWFIHNTRALGAFMPLGSQSYSLASGWSDRAWETGGHWESLGDAFFAGVVQPGDPPLVQARIRATYGRARAVEWIRQHPFKSVVLAARKALALWVPEPSIAMLYLVLPLVGLTVLAVDEIAVILAFLGLNTLAVAATWVWEGDRFQVPLLGLLHYAGAAGLLVVLKVVSDRWQLGRTRPAD